MTVGRFLAGIAALIWDPQTDRYLLLRRAADKDFGAGGWECPTGRLDQGEGFSDALHREVQEELGVEIRLEFPIGTTHFYRGTSHRDNELVGVIYCCSLLPGQTIRTSNEHDAHQWLTALEIERFLPAEHWLQPVIRRTLFLQQHLPDPVRELYRTAGFDL